MTHARTETTPEALDAVLDAAEAAAPVLAATPPGPRADRLRAAADALDAAADTLVPLAARESGLTTPRLTGELARTTFQLRLFAEVVEAGRYLEATVDHADPDWPMGARPDLRRTLRPLGPAAVYAAGNFPFAFSVAGGDTAAALAAGAPVVVKAHPGHPGLSRTVAALVESVLEGAGAPAGTFALVEGLETGRALVLDRRITVAAFTGSLAGGRALFDLAVSRPCPIPFYGELGSVNPVFVTRSAADARGEAIAEGFVASMTLGVGQFCTKPGLILLPEGSSVVDLVAEAVREAPGGTMLGDGIRDAFVSGLTRLDEHEGVERLVGEPAPAGDPSPVLYGTDVDTFLADSAGLLEEHFGPAALVVRYRSDEDLVRAARSLDGQLTATVHAEDGEALADLVAVLADRVGRVLRNGWPTGVSVTYAQQHGGPYPATTAPQATSVGTASIGRFLRPVTFQDMEDELLPPPLQEANPWGVPRLVDGVPGT